jgi:hypothetical protein
MVLLRWSADAVGAGVVPGGGRRVFRRIVVVATA